MSAARCYICARMTMDCWGSPPICDQCASQNKIKRSTPIKPTPRREDTPTRPSPITPRYGRPEHRLAALDYDELDMRATAYAMKGLGPTKWWASSDFGAPTGTMLRARADEARAKLDAIIDSASWLEPAAGADLDELAKLLTTQPARKLVAEGDDLREETDAEFRKRLLELCSSRVQP